MRSGALTLACLAALASALPAAAEDIDVYTARIAAGARPNILFVLDFSGSMNEDVNGDRTSVSGLPSKIDILREAMTEVLDGSVGRIRAGIGSIYASSPSGVRWPITDLDADAHDTDPAIPAGAFSARDIMVKQLDRGGAGGDTRTVNALVEGAMYFRGGPVANGGRATNRPWNHEPDTWNATAERYDGGNRWAAIAASYTPSGAYWRDVYEAGNYGYCSDYSVSGGSNGCAGKATYDCEYRKAHSWGGEAGSEGSSGGSRDAREVCKYEHPDAWQGANYIAPDMDSSACTIDNRIVLISDGLPDHYQDNEALRSVIGDPAGCEDLDLTIFASVAGGDWNGNCGPEVAHALANTPLIPGRPDSTVRTYTIGFGTGDVGDDFLESVAASGEGQFFAADSTANLIKAIGDSTNEFTSESFTELAVDVDRAAFSHADRAYLGLFTPSAQRAWSGNLKGYFLDRDGLKDTNGLAATLPTTTGTRFVPEAQSFWSREPDGDAVAAGGASALMTNGARTLYTWLGDAASLPPAGTDLALSAANRLVSGNGAIKHAHLGLAPGDGAREAALDWIQDAPMGDPLHSRSLSVDYGERQVVYVMTNQGLLHAIDATAPSGPGASDHGGGEEIFAYMPKRLLSNLPVLADNPIDTGEGHVYGLDGAIARWHEDTDADGVVDAGESLLLVLGMRRGGEAYHAIDVTDPERPTLRWVIDSGTPGFAELAQSWSRPALVNVMRGGAPERVLMFGGGYDPALDGTNAPQGSRGNAVFVVDRDGDLVRKFTAPQMRHALAADLTVIDSDADGLADRLYAGDLGGKVWRVDFDDVGPGGSAAVTLLADLGGGAHQPFFSAPSVALNRDAAGDYLSIALGSGNRTEPLAENTANAFFMLRDRDVAPGAPSAPRSPIAVSDLHDASEDPLGSSDPGVAAAARAALAAARGWRVSLAPGEKSLTQLVSFEGKLLATTYGVGAGGVDPCTDNSVRRLYMMDLATASALDGVLTFEDGGEFEVSPSNPTGRWREQAGAGIPSAPQVLLTGGSGDAQVVVDREPAATFRQALTRVYWHAK